ncbi:hypothetical protein JCM15519_07130 [Fundidesulfovibrio butyratiphilus]
MKEASKKPGKAFSLKGDSPAMGKTQFSLGKKAKVPDPLANVEYTGDPEMDATRELDALKAAMDKAAEDAKHKAIRDREKNVARKIDGMTNPWFYSRLGFESEEQARAFNEALGMTGDAMVLDGVELARRLGINLPSADVPMRANAKPDKKLNSLVRKFRED